MLLLRGFAQIAPLAPQHLVFPVIGPDDGRAMGWPAQGTYARSAQPVGIGAQANCDPATAGRYVCAPAPVVRLASIQDGSNPERAIAGRAETLGVVGQAGQLSVVGPRAIALDVPSA
jgi:hypothetical protein